MALLNDVRVYAMVALTVLVLLVLAMCSGNHDNGPDKHASTAARDTKVQADKMIDAAPNTKDDKQAVTEQNTSRAAATNSADSQTNVETKSLVSAAISTSENSITTENAAANAETAALDASITDASITAESNTAAAQLTGVARAESKNASAIIEPFELTPLSDTGEKLPDLQTDIENFKTDIERYNARIQSTNSLLENNEEVSK